MAASSAMGCRTHGLPWSWLAPHSGAFPLPVCNKDAAVPDTGILKSSLQTKSFSDVVKNACSFTASQLPSPCIKGDVIAIKIPEDEYLSGVEACKLHLYGRLILPKGATPPKMKAICEKLSALWQTESKWKIVPIDFNPCSVKQTNVQC